MNARALTAAIVFLLAAPVAAMEDEALFLPRALADDLVQPHYSESGIFTGVRAGVWYTGEFDSLTTSGRRQVTNEALATGGVDLGYRIGNLSFYGTADFAGSKDLHILLAGVHVGTTKLLPEYSIPSPTWIHAAIGGIAGDYDVYDNDFGKFDTAFGFQARLLLGWDIARSSQFTLWVDYREIQFDYNEAVIEGDKHAVGTSAAFGLSLIFLF